MSFYILKEMIKAVIDIYNTNKKYNIIYADPPWHYTTWRKGNGTAEKHYKTMNIEDIVGMKEVINKISEKDCILFLWGTWPCLNEALQVINDWGFKYKTCGFLWVKLTKLLKVCLGLGFWTRGNTEYCLIATKGHIKRNSKRVSQVLMSVREEHSKKPDETRERIVELIGDLPRIELFARKEYQGWDCWGNEV